MKKARKGVVGLFKAGLIFVVVGAAMVLFFKSIAGGLIVAAGVLILVIATILYAIER